VSDLVFLDLPTQIRIGGYGLHGPDVLNLIAALAEGHGDFIDVNRVPIWDHPEWRQGWTRDGEPYEPPFERALPYVGEGVWLWQRQAGLA
jgi:hypothetical protein